MPPKNTKTGPLLAEASMGGQWNTVTDLLLADCDPNVCALDTPVIFFAADAGRSEMVALLVACGATLVDTQRVSLRNSSGHCLVHRAAMRGDVKTMETLIDFGCDPDEADFTADNGGKSASSNTDGLTPLCYAVINGHTNLVVFLLSINCSVTRFAAPNAPLYAFVVGKTVSAGYTEMIRILSRAGVDFSQFIHQSSTQNRMLSSSPVGVCATRTQGLKADVDPKRKAHSEVGSDEDDSDNDAFVPKTRYCRLVDEHDRLIKVGGVSRSLKEFIECLLSMTNKERSIVLKSRDCDTLTPSDRMSLKFAFKRNTKLKKAARNEVRYPGMTQQEIQMVKNRVKKAAKKQRELVERTMVEAYQRQKMFANADVNPRANETEADGVVQSNNYADVAVKVEPTTPAAGPLTAKRGDCCDTSVGESNDTHRSSEEGLYVKIHDEARKNTATVVINGEKMLRTVFIARLLAMPRKAMRDLVKSPSCAHLGWEDRFAISNALTADVAQKKAERVSAKSSGIPEE